MTEPRHPLEVAADRMKPPTPELVARYFSNPRAFVREVITWPAGEGPTAYQDRVLGQLERQGRLAVRGPHGLGKTADAAWAAAVVRLHAGGGRDRLEGPDHGERLAPARSLSVARDPQVGAASRLGEARTGAVHGAGAPNLEA